MTDVFVDNKYVGSVKDGHKFRDDIINERRAGKMPSEVNVLFHEATDQVFVETSKGRTIRPLIVVKDGKSTLTQEISDKLNKNEMQWSDLIKMGVIEYLDPSEEEDALVAFYENELTAEHTHLSITPLDILGLCTSLIPFGQFNQGVRLSQGSKNQKQAVGFYAANFFQRIDMDVNILHYPQNPVVKTLMHDVSDYYQHPSGQNVVIAIMPYDGYNMEDAVVINKGSVDRGLGRSTYFRPVVSEELRYPGGLMDEISIPDKDVKGFRTEKDYRFLEEDGIVSAESKVQEGDVIIGKTSPPRFLNSMDEYNLAGNVRRESSMTLEHGERGVVDLVLLSENEEGNRLIQVRLREQRIPEIGDKFISRHGQKGVIGMVVPEQNIPFSENGMRPDILFNPHGLPKRMTVAHLIEMLGGKVGALEGRYIDGTTFDSENEKDLRSALEKLGFKEDGTEIMYSPITGKQYQARIYIGSMYYQRLKHMVANKMHSRARGPIQLLTRQPTEGRAKEGGLRLGEMEKDTFIAHGASLLLKERFDSDKTIVPICEKCGLIGIYDSRKNKSYCPTCGDAVEMSNIELSYAFKLFMDELRSFGIYPKMMLKSEYDPA
ncbi:TPA: DNA-directed RNA polymerase subunit B [Candidatus Woesearchaeota archaeon]|nr:DNA-directed RNA polymerase subunit B [Candidatus Woesearchaeota archaeon]HIH31705.1 DNA-directed RNA polymerase subunit B [Candidatus Woesearchaeota archaeon]HIH55009.1 DNA-directed RNA polymerase subunit B [Candidatus Woesearchaeota archaeon]HIJ01017.1 DNA-directed RNA polymerase subunit B [Candidatus Woesearchaeota archaeon]HIJ14733.1 DNA-directed RNA polymerase subunit B [Candidatus Woesearchaeota archaeon]